MNKTRLIEISALVTVAVFATFVSHADQPIEIGEINVEKVTQKVNKEYAQLFAKFDTDKNGLLSKAEVAESKNDILMRNFKAIDKNTDANISDKELSDFSASIKVK